MATILLCSTPLYGHLAPLLALGRHLAERGHHVIVLTGSAFEERVHDAGLHHEALTGRADFDERDEAGFLPDLHRHRGLALSRYQVEQTFVATLPEQHRAVRAVLDRERIDAVVTDSFFAGILPLLEADPASRPPILGVGIGPLVQVSRDVAPFNTALPPSATTLGRLRNRALNLLVARLLFAKTQRLAERLVQESAGVPLRTFVLDFTAAFDRFVQLGPAEFEYPRSDLSPNVVFAGPIPSTPSPAALPDWWADLHDGRPVVHVTQGTLDNHDFGKVVRPTLEALAHEDVLVVVSTGRAPLASLGPLPANARAAEFLPYEQLLPLTSVMVTNGGFGGTLLALRHGVPLVVAGAAEDKPEVAARVAHFGVGVDLRTGRPSAEALRTAIRAVLRDPSYRARAVEMAAAIARCSPLATIDDELSRLLRGERRG
ncbi:MGT family glycosyltransferase [Rathayibacter sp. PhB151]|uniref:glycosyltransferase n=1 Tax=Rathayibacter sp. PhB151 TaxID=2485189 RepID=UPI0010643253|nr:glycosyltransferase [Rathayibacter sp. PhB151]TDX79151.1 MGT family glycosyltransferase [Rathayibacter sp. PhB151]